VNGHEDANATRVGPTVLAALVVAALVASIVALGAVIADDHPTVSATSAASDASAAPSPSAFKFADKPADGWEPRDPTAPPASTEPAATVHPVTLEATEQPVEIAPGVTQLMWTFGGKVPGPTLRGKVGDTFEITLVNKGVSGHSIDFHASKVAWNDEMRTINSGESLVYRFEAKHAGIFMYHCGSAPTIHHIGMGMYGAIIVDPPELAPVDREYVLVQSELYRASDPEQPADVNRMLAEQWDAVVFNGYVNQYRDHPIRVEPGERVRAWIIDDGPSENSSWHVVGSIFDTVYKEGHYLLRPDDASLGGAQALDLQPAQGGFVEFSFDEAGLYPFVTHKFASASKGALGFFQAGEVAAETAGH
jgi:nitrite reductase (NO-forming)